MSETSETESAGPTAEASAALSPAEAMNAKREKFMADLDAVLGMVGNARQTQFIEHLADAVTKLVHILAETAK